MATIKIKLPDPIGAKGEITEIGIKEPRGATWRDLEALGNMHADGRNFSLVLDIVRLCSDPVLTPPQIEDTETGLSMRDLAAIDEAISPFFAPGNAATGGAGSAN